MQWQADAKCLNYFNRLTKKYCADCPVIGDCYSFAVVHQERGFWGGTFETERTPEALSYEVINALRSAFRSQGLLEERDYLSVDQELLPVPPQEQSSPISLVEAYRESSPDQSLAEPA